MEEKFCVLENCSFYFLKWCYCWNCDVDRDFECLYGMTKKELDENV